MRNKLSESYRSLVALSVAFTLFGSLAAHGQIVSIFTDDFTAGEGQNSTFTYDPTQTAAQYASGVSVTSASTYTRYEGFVEPSPAPETGPITGLSDLAGTGANGSAGLTSYVTNGNGETFGGYASGRIVLPFTAGSITAADIASIDVSLNFTLNNSAALILLVNPVDANNNAIGGTNIGVYAGANSGNSGGTFALEDLFLSTGDTQTIANELNSGNSNAIDIQILDTFNSNGNPASIVISNLAVNETLTPEPSTWALIAVGSASLCLLVRRRVVVALL